MAAFTDEERQELENWRRERGPYWMFAQDPDAPRWLNALRATSTTTTTTQRKQTWT